MEDLWKSPTSQNDRPCFWSESQNHDGRYCPAWDTICSNCDKKGHFQPSVRLIRHVVEVEEKEWIHFFWLEMSIVKNHCSAQPAPSLTRSRGTQRLFSVKISVWRSKNCLEFSISWGRLKISWWPFHSCTIFKAYPINSLQSSEV